MSLSQGLYGKYCNGNGNHDDYQYYDDNDDGEEDNDKGLDKIRLDKIR